MKHQNQINLFQQFQISIRNYFFLLEYICNKNNKSEIINNINTYKEKIFSSAEIILQSFIDINNEYKKILLNANEKKDEINNINNKELREKEIILNYYIIPLCENIFPIIKKSKFYEDDKYRNIFCQIFLEMISCENLKIRTNIKELLNISFDVLYKDT